MTFKEVTNKRMQAARPMHHACTGLTCRRFLGVLAGIECSVSPAAYLTDTRGTIPPKSARFKF